MIKITKNILFGCNAAKRSSENWSHKSIDNIQSYQIKCAICNSNSWSYVGEWKQISFEIGNKARATD